MDVPGPVHRIYRFGLYQWNPLLQVLTRDGRPVRMSGQPLQVLCQLVQRSPEIVTREELQRLLWPEGTNVEFDISLNAALKRLRAGLRDDADNPRFIETIPRRGYRFIAPVECILLPEPKVERNLAAIPEPSVPASESEKHRLFPFGRKWKTWALALVAAVVVVGAGLGYRWKSERVSVAPATPREVIAVLPFSNDGTGPDLDYLRYAIPVELITDLSHVRSLTVRSFASTSSFASHPADPATIGRGLRVPYILGGAYFLENGNLHVALKLTDVSRAKFVWQEEIKVGQQKLIDLNNEIAVHTRSMLSSMNVSEALVTEIPTPANERAFDLYLRSLADTHNYPGSNLTAIKNLEESAALDNRYAPVWRELCWREQVEYLFGDRDAALLIKSEDACKQEVSLDSGDVFDAPIQMAVRQGRLVEAYDEAADLLRRRPDSSDAHYTMSVVLWYAGLLDEAENQCNTALAIDPGNSRFTICARPFVLQGRYDMAAKFLYLGNDAVFTGWLRTEIDLRSGDNTAALADAHVASRAHLHFEDLIRLYLDHAPQADFNPVVAGIEQTETDPKTHEEPSTLYDYATILSFSGQSDAALDMLRHAVQGNYCSYPAMDNDPLFNFIRQRPEFVALRQAAIRCQQDFLAHRERVDAAPARASRPGQ